MHKRWWQLRDNAVEIFLTNGRTLLLAFDNAKVGWSLRASTRGVGNAGSDRYSSLLLFNAKVANRVSARDSFASSSCGGDILFPVSRPEVRGRGRSITMLALGNS